MTAKGEGDGMFPQSQQESFVSGGRTWIAVMVMSGFISRDGEGGHWIMAVERGIASPAALSLVWRSADQA